MENVEYYMNLPYKLEIMSDLDEDGYVAHYPELSGCIAVGDSAERAVSNAIGVLSIQSVNGWLPPSRMAF